jgi:hypothetical protein
MSPVTGLTADPAQQLLASLFNDPLLGGLSQAANVHGAPAKSNLQQLGLASHGAGAIAATGVCVAVPIGVAAGDTFSAVSILVAAAAVTPTHSFAALYSGIGVPALLGQSADRLTTAIGASAAFTWTLATPITITPAMAPAGFIYASVSVTAGTPPTALGVAVPTGGSAYVWFPGMPLAYALSHGSAVAGTAPATITGQTAVTPAPYVVLS